MWIRVKWVKRRVRGRRWSYIFCCKAWFRNLLLGQQVLIVRAELKSCLLFSRLSDWWWEQWKQLPCCCHHLDSFLDAQPIAVRWFGKHLICSDEFFWFTIVSFVAAFEIHWLDASASSCELFLFYTWFLLECLN